MVIVEMPPWGRMRVGRGGSKQERSRNIYRKGREVRFQNHLKYKIYFFLEKRTDGKKGEKIKRKK